MNRQIHTLVLACGLLCVQELLIAQPRQYALEDVIRLARNQAPASKQAETRKENRYWQYRFFQSNYNPQLRLTGFIPAYNRDFLANRLDDGTIVYQPRQQLNPTLLMGLFQPIALTGGSISINSDLNQFNDLGRDITNWNSTWVNMQLQQPLGGFNELKWDKRIDPLLYEESRREYAEEMETVSREAVDQFFTVLDAQINLQVATYNLANNDTIYRIEEGRYNIGTTTRDKLLQAQLQLLRSQQEVTEARINVQNARLHLRSFVGLRDEEEFTLLLPEDIPAMQLSVDDALAMARENRAAFVAFERRRLQAEEEVAEAKGARFSASLNAAYGLNSSGSTLDEVYHDPLNQQRVNVSVNIPILDWGRSKARIETAAANKKLNDFIIAQDQVNFEQEIITAIRQFDVLLSQIEITRKSDQVAEERYTVSQNRYLIGKIDITNLNIALTEKDNAKRSYLNALQSFWSAYYDLRRLTLYDFVTGQRLYLADE